MDNIPIELHQVVTSIACADDLFDELSYAEDEGRYYDVLNVSRLQSRIAAALASVDAPTRTAGSPRASPDRRSSGSAASPPRTAHTRACARRPRCARSTGGGTNSRPRRRS